MANASLTNESMVHAHAATAEFTGGLVSHANTFEVSANLEQVAPGLMFVGDDQSNDTFAL